MAWGGQADAHCTDLLIGWLVLLLVMCMLEHLLLTHSLALPLYCLSHLHCFFLLALYPFPPFFSPLTHSFVQSGWFVVKV